MKFQEFFKQTATDATQWQHILSGCTCQLAKTEKFWFSTTPETGEWCVSNRETGEMILREGSEAEAAQIWERFCAETRYISFCGVFSVPENFKRLEAAYPLQYDEIFEGTDSHGDDRYREVSTGFRDGLNYEAIDGQDSLTVYLARIDGNTGHLVASCPAGGWADETFVFLDESGAPVKSEDNFNPNPVRQLV